MSKFFSGGRPAKVGTARVAAARAAELHRTAPDAGAGAAPAVRDASVESRIKALEEEINQFKAENKRILDLRNQQEIEVKNMQADELQFRREMEKQRLEFESYKAEESQKMAREKKVWEKHYKAARDIPNRKERQEIEQLQNELAAQTQTIVDMEKRNKLNSGRLNDRVRLLTQQNLELTNEVRELEKLRLNAWELANQDSPVKGARQGSPARPNQGLSSSQPSSPYRAGSGFPLNGPGPGMGADRSPDHHGALSLQRSVGSPSRARFEQRTLQQPVPRDAAQLDGSFEQPQALQQQRGLGSGGGREGYAQPGLARETLPAHRDIIAATAADPASGHPVPTRGFDDEGAAAAEAGHMVVSKYPNGKVEKIYPNGTKLISFGDGSRKEVYADGHTVVRFYNGDIKQTFPNRQVIYYYAEAETTHTTFPDGLEILEFANGQTEKNYPDGTQEIGFPDKTKKYIFSNGEEETVFADGTVQRLTSNGERVIEYPNGQREVHTANYRKRRYPNGTVKIVYPDGRQETKYASGRVRVKDKDGYVIVDTHVEPAKAGGAPP